MKVILSLLGVALWCALMFGSFKLAAWLTWDYDHLDSVQQTIKTNVRPECLLIEQADS